MNEDCPRLANGVGKNDIGEPKSPHPPPPPFLCGPPPVAMVEANVVVDRREGEREAAAPGPTGISLVGVHSQLCLPTKRVFVVVRLSWVMQALRFAVSTSNRPYLRREICWVHKMKLTDAQYLALSPYPPGCAAPFDFFAGQAIE